MRQFKLLLIIILIFVFGCKNSSFDAKKEQKVPEKQTLGLDYAQGFRVKPTDNGYELEVFNPWQGAKNVNYKYKLIERQQLSKTDSAENAIPIPISRAICLSTTHIAYIDQLNSSATIVGVSGSDFVSSSAVRRLISEGKVSDVGYEQSINYELVLSLKPDVVFSYGVGAEAAGYLHKLHDLDIPVVFVGDYLETSPLGKAEWLKFFGAMLGREKMADSLFTIIENDYVDTRSIVENSQTKPNVFINLPWNDTWYFPGGNSYMANLIRDAGGNYLLSHLDGNSSHPFSIESALVKGMEADVWINTGSAESLHEISSNFPQLKVLPVIKSGNVYNSVKRTNNLGGNDFYESGAVKPNLILKDLVKIFYPDSIEHELVYFQKLE